jgi:hypothetical protein
MTNYRVAFALVLLVVMTAFTGCGGDDEVNAGLVDRKAPSENAALC